MKHALTYSLKVWLTAVLLGPILTRLGDALIHPRYPFDFNSVFGFFGLTATYGLILSLPSWLLLLLTVWLTSFSDKSMHFKKVVITIAGCVLTVMPFYLVFGHDDDAGGADLLVWTLSYTVVIVGAIWFYKLKTIRAVMSDTQD